MQKELFTDFCIRFWQDNFACSQTTLAYRRDKIKCIELYAVPFFKTIYIEEITPNHIVRFITYLSQRQTSQYTRAEQQGIRYQKNHFLSRGSIRIIRTAVSQPLFYALKHKLNTHAGAWKLACRVQRQGEREYYYDGMVAPRDIFTIEELDALTASDWHNERAYMMFLVARYTGMRCGELRALRIQDIHAEYIQIHHAYNSVDGLKCTKNGSRRRFPIFAQLYHVLREYLATLPESLTYSGECYVFPSFIKRGTPVGAGFAGAALNMQMKKLGIPKVRIDSEIPAVRTFHSLRHCMDTYLSNNTNLSFTSISYLMGHSPQMVEHYSKHFSNNLYKQAVSQIALSGLWPKSSALQLEGDDTVADCMKDCVPKRAISVSSDVVERLYGIYCQLGELLQHLR